MYYIKGNNKKGNIVIKILENKGGVNAYHQGGNGIDNYYYLGKNNVIECATNEETKKLIRFLGTELKLKDQWIPKRGEVVLVADKNDSPCIWYEGIFSFYDEITGKYCVQGGIAYNMCEPFDETKLGKWVTK